MGATTAPDIADADLQNRSSSDGGVVARTATRSVASFRRSSAFDHLDRVGAGLGQAGGSGPQGVDRSHFRAEGTEVIGRHEVHAGTVRFRMWATGGAE
jgi:hypothetical protein